MSDSIAARWKKVRAQVDEAATRAGRDPSAVCLVAVSKTHPASAVVEAFRAGARDFGENRAQELVEKRDAVAQILGDEAAQVRWHFIGGLQSRKAKLLRPGVFLLHSVDRASLLNALDKFAAAGDPPQPVLIQVNIGGEASKGGLSAGDVPDFAQEISGRSGVVLQGLMAIPPRRADLDDARRDFEALRAVQQVCAERLGDSELVSELSMGMSHDFEVAVAAGATLVRVGTAIFGARG